MASMFRLPAGLMPCLAMVLGSVVLVAPPPAALASPPPWQVNGLIHYERGRRAFEHMHAAWHRGDVMGTCHHFHQALTAWNRALSIGREAQLSPAQRVALEQHRLMEERRLHPWRARCQARPVTAPPESLVCLQPERPKSFC